MSRKAKVTRDMRRDYTKFTWEYGGGNLKKTKLSNNVMLHYFEFGLNKFVCQAVYKASFS